jgi:hypothetical protein
MPDCNVPGPEPESGLKPLTSLVQQSQAQVYIGEERERGCILG